MRLSEFKYQPHEHCDLHVHSIYSDGVHDSAELIAMAKGVRLTAFALTDHHTVAGINEFIFEGAKQGIYVIPGIEINSLSGDFLGYFIDHQNVIFNQFLTVLNDADSERLLGILLALNHFGLSISKAELEESARPAFPRRSHLARLMVRKGYVNSTDEAFTKIFNKNAPHYIKSLSPDADHCVDAIRSAGGVAVLAHPFHEFADRDRFYIRKRLHYYHQLGVVGYEYYTDLKPSYIRIQDYIHKIARDLGWLQVHGSNFHGISFSRHQLGSQYTTGDTMAQLIDHLDKQSIHKSFFQRLFWRSENLDEDEFKTSLYPTEVTLDEIHFTELLELPLPDPDMSRLPLGCPFIIIHGRAIKHPELTLETLENAGYELMKRVERNDYFKISWLLYEMSKGTYETKIRDLLKFNLDFMLWGEDAQRCMIVFMNPPSDFDLRKIKKSIRKNIGKIQFYRLNYNGTVDTHFDSFVHIPDEDRVNIECFYLKQLGIDIP